MNENKIGAYLSFFWIKRKRSWCELKNENIKRRLGHDLTQFYVYIGT